MPLYLRELSDNKKTFFIWIAVLIVMNILSFSVYPSFADASSDFQELLQNYPEAVIKMISADQLDFSKILHFFGMEVYLFITLLGSIYAMILGSGILAKEQDDKTIEFLLAKPLSRKNIVNSKIMAVFTYILFFNIILFISNYALLEAFKRDEYSLKIFMVLSLGGLMLHLTFSAIGLFISSIIVKVRAAMSISLGIVLGMYFLSIISSISDRLSNLKYITPFKYVESADLIANGRISYTYIIIIIIIIIFFTSATYVYYSRKDLQ